MSKRLTKYYRLAATPMLPKHEFNSRPMYPHITQSSSRSVAQTSRTVLPNWQHNSTRTAARAAVLANQNSSKRWCSGQNCAPSSGSTVLPEQGSSGSKNSSQNLCSDCACVSEPKPEQKSGCACITVYLLPKLYSEHTKIYPHGQNKQTKIGVKTSHNYVGIMKIKPYTHAIWS